MLSENHSFGFEPETTEEVQEESIKLSPESVRTMLVAHIAEQMINEDVDSADSDLEKYGLMTEGKLTPKGKEMIKKYLPTIFAS
jgi:hypothetical protein